MNNVMKSWKTTLAGAGLAAFHVLQFGVNWKSLLVAAFTAGLGAVAKDHNVTGV